MRYLVKGGMFSSYGIPTVPMDVFHAEDEQQQRVYQFEVSTLGDRNQISDAKGGNLGWILTHACTVHLGQEQVVRVAAHSIRIGQRGFFGMRGAITFQVHGEPNHYEYGYTASDGRKIGEVSRKGLNGNCYSVNVEDPSRCGLLLISASVCLDYLRHWSIPD